MAIFDFLTFLDSNQPISLDTVDFVENEVEKYEFSCNFNVRIESKVPTPGLGVLKYGESNGGGLDPELGSRKSNFSDRGTLNLLKIV